MKPMDLLDLEPQTETLAVLLTRLGVRALQATELERLLGIVLRVCDAAALADQDNALGPPAYMAPEQARGRRPDLHRAFPGRAPLTATGRTRLKVIRGGTP